MTLFLVKWGDWRREGLLYETPRPKVGSGRWGSKKKGVGVTQKGRRIKVYSSSSPRSRNISWKNFSRKPAYATE